MASFWLYFIGVELVSILTVLAQLSHLTQLVAGMIVLGLGNSIAALMKAVAIVRTMFLLFSDLPRVSTRIPKHGLGVHLGSAAIKDNVLSWFRFSRRGNR